MEEVKVEDKKEKMSNFVKRSISDTKKAFNMETMKPVISRVRKRVKEIQELSRAKNEKITRGGQHLWFTTPPKMFISNLNTSISNNVGTISYYVYETDGVNKKLVSDHKQIFDEVTGEKKTIMVNSRFNFEKLVIETIEYGKMMHTEEVDQRE